ncbi:MAG: hypothetical protein K6F53_11755 [Lachnospiraceae bacterium]|nr:hypothetical protein [Lachnospiraceae bacterium]
MNKRLALLFCIIACMIGVMSMTGCESGKKAELELNTSQPDMGNNTEMSNEDREMNEDREETLSDMQEDSDQKKTEWEYYDCLDEVKELQLQRITLIRKKNIKGEISEGRRHRISANAHMKVQIDDKVFTLGEDTMKEVVNTFEKDGSYKIENADLDREDKKPAVLILYKNEYRYCQLCFSPDLDVTKRGDFFLKEVKCERGMDPDDVAKKNIWFQGGFRLDGNNMTKEDLESFFSERGYPVIDFPDNSDYINRERGLMRMKNRYVLYALRYDVRELGTGNDGVVTYVGTSYSFYTEEGSDRITSITLYDTPITACDHSWIMGRIKKAGGGYDEANYIVDDNGNPLVDYEGLSDVLQDIPNSPLPNNWQGEWLNALVDTDPPAVPD